MFQLLFGGKLTPEQQGPLADHAAACPQCHAVVEAMVTQHHPIHAEGRPLAVGSVIGGRFRIEEVLGTGGMGIVVAATHLELGSRVAIKFMRDEKLAGAGAVAAERFIREARAVVKLRTEHVCRVFDVARLDSGAPYIVMELLAGVDLARTIAQRPLPATIAVEYIMQAAVALAEAHAQGIVHRDLKPANLFVTRRRDGGPLVKVLDFGIAKALTESDSRLTQTRAMLGSPGYMSPEQLDSPRDVDGRTDIWALGVTLYQLLSGRLPFWGRNQTEIAVKIAAESPPPLEVDQRLAAVVMRCLEKSCDDRYQDVAALAAELRPFGGPRARRIVAAIAQATREPAAPPGELTPQSLHVVPAGPTAVTLATGIGTAASVAASVAAGPSRAVEVRPSAAALARAAPSRAVDAAAGTGPSRAVEAVRAPVAAAGIPAAASRGFASAPSPPPSSPALAAGSGTAHLLSSRRTQIAVAAVIGLVAAAGIGVTVRGLMQRDDAAAAAPSGPGSAAAKAVAAAAAAPPARSPSLAPSTTPVGPPPPPSSGTPSATPGTLPSPPSGAPSAIPSSSAATGSAAMPLSSFAAARRTCQATFDPATAEPTRAALIADCWCQPHDPGNARKAFALLRDARDRAAVRAACAKLGVALR
jgi:serine/threonine-protein kinase